jgi:hypothetical protein
MGLYKEKDSILLRVQLFRDTSVGVLLEVVMIVTQSIKDLTHEDRNDLYITFRKSRFTLNKSNIGIKGRILTHIDLQ